jgi:hypothetical protein
MDRKPMTPGEMSRAVRRAAMESIHTDPARKAERHNARMAAIIRFCDRPSEGAWVTSAPGSTPITVETTLDSKLPDELRKFKDLIVDDRGTKTRIGFAPLPYSRDRFSHTNFFEVRCWEIHLSKPTYADRVNKILVPE